MRLESYSKSVFTSSKNEGESELATKGSSRNSFRLEIGIKAIFLPKSLSLWPLVDIHVPLGFHFTTEVLNGPVTPVICSTIGIAWVIAWNISCIIITIVETIASAVQYITQGSVRVNLRSDLTLKRYFWNLDTYPGNTQCNVPAARRPDNRSGWRADPGDGHLPLLAPAKRSLRRIPPQLPQWDTGRLWWW